MSDPLTLVFIIQSPEDGLARFLIIGDLGTRSAFLVPHRELGLQRNHLARKAARFHDVERNLRVPASSVPREKLAHRFPKQRLPKNKIPSVHLDGYYRKPGRSLTGRSRLWVEAAEVRPAAFANRSG